MYSDSVNLNVFTHWELIGYYPFNLKRRSTKSLLVEATKPFFLIALLRFVDFFVRMCLLKAFWKVISPVPVTLKRFFALELVFTFGII